MILGGIGFMIGTGGSALIARTLGEKDSKRANEYFSMLIYFEIILGIILSVLGLVFLKPIACLLGAADDMMNDCLTYGSILLIGNLSYILQYSFQPLMITAEKPKFGLVITLISGVTNILFDFIMVYILDLGVIGAAIATVMSQTAGGFIPLIYFMCRNSSRLNLCKTSLKIKPILKACANGASEMVMNISMSAVNIMYNIQLIRYYGEYGVDAYGIIMYTGFIFIGTYVGYSVGIAPVISYHFGAKNRSELKNLFKKSIKLLAVLAIIMTLLAEILAGVLAYIFAGYNADLLDLTIKAIRIYSLSFTIAWFSIFSSQLFTALNNGFVSALISFLKTLVFETSCVMILPLMFKGESIWYSVILAEVLSFTVSFICIVKNSKKYEYI